MPLADGADTIRKADKIPFDLDQFRTIRIDTTSIFTMVPNLQTYKAEIATQVRMALKDPDSADNPVSTSTRISECSLLEPRAGR